MPTDDQIMLFLYKDIGLFWENTLSLKKNNDMCSLTVNKGLRTFFEQKNSIVYNITNARDIDQKDIKDNELYFTDSKSSKIKSLIHHMRNSIMHGLYDIKRRDSTIYIEFKDELPSGQRTTLKGRVQFSKLKELMNIIKNYSRS